MFMLQQADNAGQHVVDAGILQQQPRGSGGRADTGTRRGETQDRHAPVPDASTVSTHVYSHIYEMSSICLKNHIFSS